MNKKKFLCNTSPIIGLISIGRLSLLWKLFDEVILPEAVYKRIMCRFINIRVLPGMGRALFCCFDINADINGIDYGNCLAFRYCPAFMLRNSLLLFLVH